MVGTTLADRYRLGDRVATGGMGTVYQASDARLHREVAVKLLKEELAEDPKFVERFRREARAAAALSHPNIAGIFDYGEDAGSHFIVMELVKGRDLARVLREEGPLTNDRAVKITGQIAEALAHAHEAGLIHRDIKPANIIVGPNDHVKVTDFGIARAQADSTLTATGSVLGTAQYLSPEQASGDRVGPASDIYSLGIVLYEMLTGSVPFTADSAVAVAMRHLREDVPAPSALTPSVTRELDSVVAKATAKNPQDRYPDAGALARALGRPGAATPPVVVTPTAPIAAGSTAVMTAAGARETETEAWPFPSHPPRWDPRSIGRAVIAIFVILGLVATGLLLYRLADSKAPRHRDRRGAVAPPTTEESSVSEGFELQDVRGSNYKDAEKVLKDAGLEVLREEVEPENEEEKDLVLDMSPDPGTTVFPGDPVTLYVSTGPPKDEEGDVVDDIQDSFTPPGQAKKDEKGKD